MELSADLRIVCISDTHGFHRELKIPPGDILIHAGDLLPDNNQVEALADLSDWFGSLPFKHRIAIAGNHDFLFVEKPSQARKILTNAVYLENSGVELMGLKFWGCPITPVATWMAFAVEHGATGRKFWDEVPADTDVLITHSLPFRVLDTEGPMILHLGCTEVTRTILRVKPRLHVFGHVHGSYGREEGPQGVSCVNCASAARLHDIKIGIRQPIVVDLPQTSQSMIP